MKREELVDETIELRNRIAQLERVIDGAKDLIIVFGRDFSVKLMNRAAREFAGGDHPLSGPLFCYQVFFQGSESCSRIEEACPLEEVIRTKKPVTVTHACVSQDGCEKIFEVQASPIMDERGEVLQIIQVCRDVTQKLMMEETRRKLEEQLTQEQKEQSITALAGGIAHDFNNILMGVLGNAELLQMRLAPYEREQTLIQNIIKSGERMADLTKQLLTYAKNTLSQPEAVFLHDIVDEALALTHKGASLEMKVMVDMPEDLWPVFVDPGQMSQVFVNLFTNAFEAMGMSRGLLTIRAENAPNKERWECPTHKKQYPGGDYVYVRVSDTGPGIPKEMLRQIFDPFVTTKFLGRGLGLAAVFGIIRSHDGCISVESDQGQGATFHIYLQRAKTGMAVRRTEAKKAAPGRILIVDDEPQVLSLLETVLTHAGYGVLAATNGEEALRLFGQRKDDIEMAILDIQMPGMGGKRLFTELRALKPSLKVLISSGYDERTALNGIEHHAPEGFIQKPYLSGALEGKVREILRGQTASRG
ncbi:MAG TPA: ATP-binding protein [Thermodesulfovibrionales bacterium]|nr:ATP-binding protein [Thermodesulfovibrionales bacterium]